MRGLRTLEGWWAASYLVLWVVVVVLATIVVALARQIGTLHLRLGPRGALEIDDEGPPLGEPIEPLAFDDLGGAPVDLGGPVGPQLLLFVSPGCHVCEQVLPGLPAAARTGGLAPVVVTDMDVDETRLAYGDRALGAPLIAGPAAALRYEVPGTPYVIVTDELGVVRAKGTVNNLEQLEGLVDTAARRGRAARERREETRA